ncbi:hypothetical protein [Phenylobacterium sp.]|jgi:hypothetical protein|uniref:hypothetical protein n=1 Tax=Phenylobacterium sp. TaxID=1871053 RepID=UPI002F95B2A5
MPIFQTLLCELNVHMGKEKIQGLAKRADMFAPGKDPDYTFLFPENTRAAGAWMAHLKEMPPGIRAGIHAVVHHALKTEPPTQVTFAWAPGYDYEFTVWQAPDTKTTKGGITILVKSRYPRDTHPLDATDTRATAS